MQLSDSQSACAWVTLTLTTCRIVDESVRVCVCDCQGLLWERVGDIVSLVQQWSLSQLRGIFINISTWNSHPKLSWAQDKISLEYLNLLLRFTEWPYRTWEYLDWHRLRLFVVDCLHAPKRQKRPNPDKSRSVGLKREINFQFLGIKTSLLAVFRMSFKM